MSKEWRLATWGSAARRVGETPLPGRSSHRACFWSLKPVSDVSIESLTPVRSRGR